MDPLGRSCTIKKVITYTYYANKTIMHMEGRFGKFITETVKIEFMVCKWNSQFQVENTE